MSLRGAQKLEDQHYRLVVVGLIDQATGAFTLSLLRDGASGSNGGAVGGMQASQLYDSYVEAVHQVLAAQGVLGGEELIKRPKEFRRYAR